MIIALAIGNPTGVQSVGTPEGPDGSNDRANPGCRNSGRLDRLVHAAPVAALAAIPQRPGRRDPQYGRQHANGLEVLARRYARGEIDRAEYLQKKGDIVGAQVPLGSYP